MKTIDEIYTDTINILTDRGVYDPALNPQLLSLASSVKVLMLANREVDELERVSVERTSRYGSELVAHPAFKVLRDAQDSVTKQMKMVGLTVEDLGGAVESDPLVELTKSVLAGSDIKQKKLTVKKK